MGDGAGDRRVETMDQQHPFVAECHALGLQSFANCLGAERQGRRHMPVVVVGNDAQRFGGRDTENGKHPLQVLFGCCKDDVGTVFNVFAVVVDRDQVLNNREPFKAVVFVDEFL